MVMSGTAQRKRCFDIVMEVAKKANKVRESRICPHRCQDVPLPELCLDGGCCLEVALDIAAEISGMKYSEVKELLD